jgi:hypothetical protein
MMGPSEAVAEMGEVLDAAYEQLQDTGEPEVVRERIALVAAVEPHGGACRRTIIR